MDRVFSEIRPQKISEEIVHQIKSLIKDGKLKPGEKLPPERVLADMLGVGRSSLREAINILDTLGFVEIRKRKGIFIRSISVPIMSDPLRQILEEDKSTLFELYELRKDIELASTYMAAKRRREADLIAIRNYLESMEKDAPNACLSAGDDLGFHLAIAQASHNFLRVHLLKNIFDLSGDYIDFVAQKLIQEKANISVILEQHTNLVEAIQKGDQEGARALMDEHLTWVEDKWREMGSRETWEAPMAG
jgi:GntR family transcriptional repressor for pyruvate dehydrogenase complex